MASTYSSAGVYPVETDISEHVPSVATTTAAIVGYSAQGSTDVRLITTSKQFIDEYGEPDVVSGSYFHHSALAYLKRGNKLYCKRVHNGALYGGILIGKDGVDSVALDTGLSTASFDRDITIAAWESGVDIDDYICLITGKDPGVWNNSLTITITDVKTVSDSVVTDRYTFKVNVYYTDDEGDSTIVETWKVSRKTKLDGYGKQLQLETKINDYSSYIKIWDNTLANSGESDETGLADTVLPNGEVEAITVAGGSVGTTPAADPTTMQTQITGASGAATGWYAFENQDDYPIRILIEADGGNVVIEAAMIDIATDRFDCLALLNIPYASTSAANAVTYRDTTLNTDTSRASLITPWAKIWDSYNNQQAEIPLAGYQAAQCAYTDYVGNVWDAPAGHTRGKISDIGVIGLTEVYTQGERDTLYAAGVNMAQVFRGRGITIWGQKTLQQKESALDRINVRRELIYIELSVDGLVQDFVFDNNNDDVTRFRIRTKVVEFLDSLKTQGAFQTDVDEGYMVVCDSSNNTPAVIDSHELRLDMFVKPPMSAEFIRVQTIVTSTGSTFEELISNGVNL